jgi:signal transduction histidine kinase
MSRPFPRALAGILVLLLPAGGRLPASGAEAPEARAPLTTAFAVRSLPAEEARAGRPVELEAVVGFLDPPTVFVQDATGGTFFRASAPGSADALRVGDRLRVRGVTFPGLYLTGVDEARFEVLGTGPAPEPQPAGLGDLASGRCHYQRVSLEGVGRSALTVEEGLTVLRLAVPGGPLEIRLEAPLPDFPWPDARIRVTGLAAGAINDRRQLVHPYLRVAGTGDLAVLRPAPEPGTLPLTPVSGLLRFVPGEQAWAHRVRVQGVVLAGFPDGRLFLRGEPEPAGTDLPEPEPPPLPGAVAIRLGTPERFPPGTVLDVVGFPEMGRFSASLADAAVLGVSGDAGPPGPVRVSARQLFSGAHDADLVEIDAVLAEVFRTGDGTELLWRTEAGSFRSPAGFVPQAVPGSRLRLTGICRIEGAVGQGYRSVPDRVVVLPRGPEDLRVLTVPPWWTVPRLLGLVAVLLCLMALAGAWIVSLRRLVARQSVALRERIARQAALEERERIAREFHDTLEQELAGLSLRLDAAVACVLDDRAKPLVVTARRLVSRIQEEARNLVSGLRSGEDAGTPDLPAALRDLVGRCHVPGGPAVQLEVDADLPRLPADVAHHLQMMAREALANALKHAAASRVRVSLRREGDLLVLGVCDDGKGLGPDPGPPAARPGHFGCQGIRERAVRIGARVEWNPAPGGGVSFRVEHRLPA